LVQAVQDEGVENLFIGFMDMKFAQWWGCYFAQLARLHYDFMRSSLCWRVSAEQSSFLLVLLAEKPMLFFNDNNILWYYFVFVNKWLFFWISSKVVWIFAGEISCCQSAHGREKFSHFLLSFCWTGWAANEG